MDGVMVKNYFYYFYYSLDRSMCMDIDWVCIVYTLYSRLYEI